MPYKISDMQARRFLLLKQGLLGEYRFRGADGALSYIKQAGCIQYDPVDVCGRNAELTLNSRVKGFTRGMLGDLLYNKRLLFDYTDKEQSVIPIEDWPGFFRYRERSRLHGQSFEGLAALEDTALSYINEHGPVSSASLPIDGEIRWHSSIHWSGNWHGESDAARSVLEQMYTDGRLVIHHKDGSRKYYDIAGRHVPEGLLSAPDPYPERMEHIKWRVLRRIGAAGMLWDRRSDALLGIDMSTKERGEAFAALLAEGRTEEISVEGIRTPLYILAEDMPLLLAAKDIQAKPRCEFLAPLDPFLWDRKLIESIFGFSYSWEIYTPREKRKYGSYVLPVIYGERFIGRIEAAADRKAGVLHVKNIWYEDGVRQTKKLQTALRGAVKRLAAMNGCRADDDIAVLP